MESGTFEALDPNDIVMASFNPSNGHGSMFLIANNAKKIFLMSGWFFTTSGFSALEYKYAGITPRGLTPFTIKNSSINHFIIGSQSAKVDTITGISLSIDNTIYKLAIKLKTGSNPTTRTYFTISGTLTEDIILT